MLRIDGSPGIVAIHERVVLGVPVFNEARHIRRTLESIQRQVHSDFVALISDNASTDETGEICQRFVGRDSRFVYVRQPRNLGARDNFAFVREASSSPFFAWVGGHDILHPEYLLHHLACLHTEPDVCCSFTYFRIVDELERAIADERPTGVAPGRYRPLLRYIWTLTMGEEIAPVHGLFRRSMLSGIPAHACVAGDQVFLAGCSLRGRMRAHPGYLYCLRQLNAEAREETQMERITGRRGSVKDFGSTIDAYLSDFDLFVPPGSPGSGWRPLVRSILRDRFSGRTVRWTKVLRSLAKRADRVRTMLGGDPLR